MIKKQSDDPNVEAAANDAQAIIDDVLKSLPSASEFDYGGHELHIGEYGVCTACTTPIAEAQQAQAAILKKAETIDDPTIKEHLTLVADLFHLEAEAAVIRAELHNGFGTEKILNHILGFEYARHIGDDYQHSHHGGHN